MNSKHTRKTTFVLLAIGLYWLMAAASSRFPTFRHTAVYAEWKGEELHLTNVDTFNYENALVTLVCEKGKRFQFPDRMDVPVGQVVVIPLPDFEEYPVRRMNRKRFRPKDLEILPRNQPDNWQHYGITYPIRKVGGEVAASVVDNGEAP